MTHRIDTEAIRKIADKLKAIAAERKDAKLEKLAALLRQALGLGHGEDEPGGDKDTQGLAPGDSTTVDLSPAARLTIEIFR